MKRDLLAKLPTIVLGVSLAAFGLISMWDAERITREYRKPGAFDVVGPDNFLFYTGVLLILSGIAVACSAGAAGDGAHSETPLFPSTPVMIFLTACAYAAAIPLVGYLVATIAFFPLVNWLLGVRFKANMIASVCTVTVLYIVFDRLAGIPFPSASLFS